MAEFPFPLPRNPNFREFVWFEGLILPHELELIDGWWSDEVSSTAEVSGEKRYVESLRRSAVIPICLDDRSRWLFDRLQGVALKCNQQYFGFDLAGFVEPLQLAQYGESEFFDWHLDFGIDEMSQRKLSISVQLSDDDDYEGGDLQFQINQNEECASRKRGTVIVFPSFIMHRVTAVTKGLRRSLVGWVSGPPFR